MYLHLNNPNRMFSLRLKTVWLQSIGLQKRMGIEETNELPLSD